MKLSKEKFRKLEELYEELDKLEFLKSNKKQYDQIDLNRLVNIVFLRRSKRVQYEVEVHNIQLIFETLSERFMNYKKCDMTLLKKALKENNIAIDECFGEEFPKILVSRYDLLYELIKRI